MNPLGLLRTWLRAYSDCILPAIGIAGIAGFAATRWAPFGVAGAGAAFAALVGACVPQDRLRSVWLRVPWVMRWRRRKHAQWAGDHPAVRAAARREIQMLDEWWHLDPADDEARKEQQ